MAGFFQHVKWRTEVLGYDIVRGVMIPFSFDQVSGFGGWLLRKIGPISSKNKIVETGLRTAFPDADDTQIKSWVDAQWDNTGRTFAEFPMLNRIKVYGENSRVTVNGLAALKAAHAEGKGLIIVSGHFANWEIIAAAFAQAGLPINVTYRKINNPYFDKRVKQQRAKYGIQLMVAKSGARGAKDIMTTLKRGDGVALMNDQKFNEGISVPFFGVDAMTAPGPTRLALKTGAPLIPMSCKRVNGTHFEVTIHDPIELSHTNDHSADIRNGVLNVTEFVEDRIRDNPEQWFWVHRRWDKSHYRAHNHERSKS